MIIVERGSEKYEWTPTSGLVLSLEENNENYGCGQHVCSVPPEWGTPAQLSSSGDHVTRYCTGHTGDTLATVHTKT